MLFGKDLVGPSRDEPTRDELVCPSQVNVGCFVQWDKRLRFENDLVKEGFNVFMKG